MRKLFLYLLFSIVLSCLTFAQSTYTPQQNMKYLTSSPLQGRNAGTKGDSLAQIYIVENLKSLNIKPFYTDYLQPFTSKMETMRGGDLISSKNVIGLIEGTDSVLKKEFIIICAHFDHVGLEKGRIHPGANDNASGVITILNIAKMIQQNPLKRSVLVIFFGAEEKGLLGSYYFVKKAKFPLKTIDAVINFDMVGKLKQEGTLYSKGEQTAKIFSELLEKYTAKYNVKYEVSPFNYMNGSDHYPFYRKRIPVLFFNTGLDWDNYHQPSDLPEKIDYEGIELISKIGFDLITDVGNKTEKLKFNKK